MGAFTFCRKKFILIFFAFAGFSGIHGLWAQCPTISDNSQSFCDLQAPTVSSLSAVDNGGGIVWYATATSTTPLSPSAGLVSGEDYFADSAAGSCGVRPSVTVTIYSAPIGGPFQGVCVGVATEATIPAPGDPNPDIEAIGNNIQWYLTATGGTPLTPGTILNDNTIYYASQTNPDTGCETSRLAVFVNVGVVPVPTGDATQEFCNDPSNPPTVANLVASGVNNWYLTESSAAPLPLSTPLINGQSYYATTVDPPCESPTRFEVVVTLSAPNNPGTAGNLSLCENELESTGSVNLFPLLGGAPQSSGTWTGPLPTTNGAQGTLDVSGMTVAGSPYVFTYTVTGICAPASSIVTVNILPPPTAAISTNQTICAGSVGTVNFTGTPNATVTYTVNGGANQTIVLNASGNATVSQTYTQSAVYDLVSVTSAGASPCSQSVSGAVTITVLDIPVASISADTTICSGDSATVIFTGTPNSTVNYMVNGASAQVTLNAAGTATVTGNYTTDTTFTLVSVTSAGTPSCFRALTQSILITVVQPPVASISGNVSICPNSAATITFTGTPNATITYTVNGGPNQTLTLNASGSAAITQNYTATTVFTLVEVSTAGNPACSMPASGSVTVTVLPLPVASIAYDTVICTGQSAQVTITGTPNATVAYTVNGGTNQTIMLDASGTATINASYTSTTVIALVSVASAGTPSCSQPLTGSVTITVLPLPTVSIAANSTICSGESASVTFTGTANATVTYTVNGGANQTVVLSPSGNATVTGTFTSTTVFSLVEVATSGTPACSQPASGTVTITVIPPPTVAISSNTTICSGESAPVTFTGTPNATATYTVNGGPNQVITLNESGTAVLNGIYTATTVIALVDVATAGTPVCSQPVSGSVTITVQPLPQVGISANATVCSGENATVTFTGTPNAVITYEVNGGPNQTISLSSSGSATISQTYTSTTTYTLISAASTGSPACSQPQSGSVVITVIPPPTASLSAPTAVCAGADASVTVTGTPNATVSYTINGGAPQTIVLNASGVGTITGAYEVNAIIELLEVTTAGTPACSQSLSSTITVPVTPLPVVSISGSTTVCPGAPATVSFSGSANSTVSYTVNGGPVQTIVLGDDGTAMISQNYNETTIYALVSIATQGNPSCSQPQSGTVTITVVPPPTVTISGEATICSGSTASVSFSGTPNAIVTFTVNGQVQTITLDSTGNAVLTTTYTVTSVIALASAATSVPPACDQPQTGQVIISVIPAPTASISANVSVCPGGEATIAFSGTPNSTVSYTVDGGPVQTILLNASGTATIVAAYTQTTVYELVGVQSSGSPSCPATVSGTATVSVLALPVATLTAAQSQVCSGTTATITFTGTPGATVTYTVNGGANQMVTLDPSGSATIFPTVSGTTVVTLVSAATGTTPSCSQTLSESVEIQASEPPQAGNDVASVLVCATDVPVNIFNLLGNAQPGGTWAPSLTTPGFFDPAVDAPGTYVYTVDAQGPCPSDSASVTISVIEPASAGEDFEVQLCDNSTPVNLFSLLGSTAQSGGMWTPNLSNPGFFNAAVDAPGTYTYTVMGTAPCGSDSASATIIVIPAANAGTSATIAVCGNGQPVDLFAALGPDAQPGGSWFPALSSGSGSFDPDLDAPGTYIYTVESALPCIPASASVTVSLVTPPNAGSDAQVVICSNSDPQDLFLLLGNQAQTGGSWSPSLASGTGIFDPALDGEGIYTYTVQGQSPCENDTATVTVTVTPGPDAGQDGVLTLCVDSAPQNLFDFLLGSPQQGGTWSPSLSSGNGIFDPEADAPGVYTYTFFGDQPCDNDTATVTVTVNPVPDAGEDGTAFFCTNYPPGDLLNYLTGSPQPGGTWTPALASGSGLFNPLLDAPGTYTYTVGGGFCTTDTAQVTVTVQQSPNAGGTGAPLLITACQSDTAIDLFAGLNGTQDLGTWTDDDNTGALSGNLFDASAVGPGSYEFTYTVGGGVSPCLFDTATVTVVVEAPAEAGSFVGVQTFCTSAGTVDLATLLEGAQPGGTWTDADGNEIDPLLNITGFTAGSYFYTYSVSNSCGPDTQEVEISILPIPTLSIQNITLVTPICLGDAAVITLSGIGDGTYTLNYSLSGANILPAQQVTVTVSAGVATFSIPPASLANIGTTTISFDSILNVVSGCNSVLTGILVNVVVRPVSDLTDANLSSSGACPGAPVTVTITGAAMANGNYQFAYSIPGANPSSGLTGIVPINGGAGQFSLPASMFPMSGNYTLTVTGITSLSGECGNPSESASANIAIYEAPDVKGAELFAANVCSGLDNTVQISGATNLADGNYELTYQLGGDASASGTVLVTFLSGEAAFAIPASQLPASGNVTVTVSQLLTSPGACGGNTANFNTVGFDISEPQTPVLEPQGNEFCADENPTLATLSQNIQGGLNVVWYDSATGGNILSPSTLLQNGQSYFAAISSGADCESPIRLEVTVDTTVCPEQILIPDGFSPNGDNINDYFEIVNIREAYPRFRIEIYNRYGNILYKGNLNTPDWDGTAQEGGVKVGSGVVPTGVYFYILEFNDGARKPLQGRLYLSR